MLYLLCGCYRLAVACAVDTGINFIVLSSQIQFCYLMQTCSKQHFFRLHTYIHTYIHKFICLGGSEKATLKADVDPPNKSVKKKSM